MRRYLFVAALVLAGAAKAEEPGYLFDALRLPRFHAAWERLVDGVQPIPDWLLNFKRDYDGAAGAMVPAQIGGKPYRLTYVCDPEDCAGHKFEILFTADGARALGALGGKDVPPGFYGAPSPAEQEALANALNPPAPKTEAAKPDASPSPAARVDDLKPDSTPTPKAEDVKPGQLKSE